MFANGRYNVAEHNRKLGRIRTQRAIVKHLALLERLRAQMTLEPRDRGVERALGRAIGREIKWLRDHDVEA